MNKRKIGIAVALLLLLIGGAVWALMGRADAARQGQADAKRYGQLVAGRAAAAGRDLRKEIGKLTPAEREKLWGDRQRQRDQRIKDYFAAPPNERKKILDKQIAEDEKRRKERAALRARGTRRSRRARPEWKRAESQRTRPVPGRVGPKRERR